MQPEGTLVLRHALERRGEVSEEQLPFSDLQQLLNLCASHAQGAAFVQVRVSGESDGRQQTLVLDFGRFGRAE